MYRATAEAVSGLKVFADGKWLTCIGNKPVRVGDRIWTDGRCVYGFNKEAQSPMVIVSPQRDEDWAIPIIMWDYDTAELCYYIFAKNQLTKLSRQGEALEHKRRSLMVNDKEGNVYLLPDAGFFTVRTKHASINTHVIDVNCDDKGNFYAICWLDSLSGAPSSGGYSGSDTNGKILIIKNSRVIHSFFTNAVSLYELDIGGLIIDDNTWWVKYRRHDKAFFQNPDGEKEMSVGLSFPLKDNYHGVLNSKLLRNYTIDDYDPVYAFNPYQKQAILDAHNNEIYNARLGALAPSIVGSLDHKNYLISAAVNGYANWLDDDYAHRQLFTCQNGVLSEISNFIYPKPLWLHQYTHGMYCINRCLRPMKNYKNWQNRIHILTLADIGVDENAILSQA